MRSSSSSVNSLHSPFLSATETPPPRVFSISGQLCRTATLVVLRSFSLSRCVPLAFTDMVLALVFLGRYSFVVFVITSGAPHHQGQRHRHLVAGIVKPPPPRASHHPWETVLPLSGRSFAVVHHRHCHLHHRSCLSLTSPSVSLFVDMAAISSPSQRLNIKWDPPVSQFSFLFFSLVLVE